MVTVATGENDNVDDYDYARRTTTAATTTTTTRGSTMRTTNRWYVVVVVRRVEEGRVCWLRGRYT